ncbi:MAG: PAQR family membrane homeostasis protein TrhA [Mycobacterium leprae]
MKWFPKDPVSALTHAVGALLSIAGLVGLLYVAVHAGTVWHVVSFAIFGASLILLYTASATYHWLNLSERVDLALRKVDHIMIFVLIAGSYTPFCLIALRGAWGWSIFGVIWGLTIGGLFMKLFWMQAPRWLYTGLYVAMGWLIVMAMKPLMAVLPAGFLWLLIGGLFYTVGAVLYATKWPNPIPERFGFHEIFHLFIMAGSLAHFWAVIHFLPPLH